MLIILIQIILNRDGINQNDIGSINNPIIVLIQLMDKFKMLEDGSNVENRFVIIFKKFFWCWNLGFY